MKRTPAARTRWALRGLGLCVSVVIIAFAVSLIALVAPRPQPVEAATFNVTLLPLEPGDTPTRRFLRFQAEVPGEPADGNQGIPPTAGAERMAGVRINPDRTTATPGPCSGGISFSLATFDGWGNDLDITGFSRFRTAFGPFVCATGLRPGNYIVSLDYQRAEGGFTYSSIITIDVPISVPDDRDNDGVLDPDDNCPDKANPDQADRDDNRIGDVCDFDPDDRDGDGIRNTADNCPDHRNPDQADFDGDRLGDVCDAFPVDTDNDGHANPFDNCPLDFNPTQLDSDDNGVGDVCEPDIDGDGVPRGIDNCPTVYNPGQEETDFFPDRPPAGDACDPPDSDGDGLSNDSDNCDLVQNRGQQDSNSDGEGDVCDTNSDTDGDGRADASDNCVRHANGDQADTDGDGIGDRCENDDLDGDGHPAFDDNCPADFNPGQFDADSDGIGDLCDADQDSDGDDIPDPDDNCDFEQNPDQSDANLDGIGDVCDVWSDTDGDGLSDADETTLGTDLTTPTPVGPGIATYTDGSPTAAGSPITSGETVGVAVPAGAGITSVGVTVTDPSGATAYSDTLIPRSPVVFSFTPIAPGPWHIVAKLYAGTTLVSTLERTVLVGTAALPSCASSISYVPIGGSAGTSGTPVTNGLAGTYRFVARLTNTSTSNLTLLVAKVTVLTNGNKLLSADNGAGVVGDVYTIPKVGAYADGVLGPGEYVDVPHVIGLASKAKFSFFTDVGCLRGG